VRNIFKVIVSDLERASSMYCGASLVLLKERGSILLSDWSTRMGVVFVTPKVSPMA